MLRKGICLSLLVIANTAFGFSPVSQVSDFVSKHVATSKAKIALACGGVVTAIVLVNKCCALYSTYQENCKIAERARQIAEAQQLMSDAPNRIEKIEAAAQTSVQEDLLAKVDSSVSPLVVRDAYRWLTVEARRLSNDLLKAKELLMTQDENVSIDAYVVKLTASETSLQAKLTELFTLPGFQVALQEELSQRIDDLSVRLSSFGYRVSQLEDRISELQGNSNGYRISNLEYRVSKLQQKSF